MTGGRAGKAADCSREKGAILPGEIRQKV